MSKYLSEPQWLNTEQGDVARVLERNLTFYGNGKATIAEPSKGYDGIVDQILDKLSEDKVPVPMEASPHVISAMHERSVTKLQRHYMAMYESMRGWKDAYDRALQQSEMLAGLNASLEQRAKNLEERMKLIEDESGRRLAENEKLKQENQVLRYRLAGVPHKSLDGKY